MKQVTEQYQKRVITEKQELDKKRESLRSFIMSPKKFGELDAEDQSLLVSQQQLMTQYADVLQRRINKFSIEGQTNGP